MLGVVALPAICARLSAKAQIRAIKAVGPFRPVKVPTVGTLDAGCRYHLGRLVRVWSFAGAKTGF